MECRDFQEGKKSLIEYGFCGDVEVTGIKYLEPGGATETQSPEINCIFGEIFRIPIGCYLTINLNLKGQIHVN